ncbi:serine/threonine-protein kinase Nek2-like [Thalassophryne amazonica]|uniref:serine/threonine-protein kinase Nek2-like n=1 Tax=Thalassophryne amazonica TaxID=390379 RepID=UPI0014716666|nr:serine/threonine-protein kinase Nek2-like [Thalassophryne amazonica]
MSFLEDYEVLCSIGSGSFGTCQKIKRKSDGKILVWKVVRYKSMKPHQLRCLLSEVKILKDLNHPNIVQYVDHFLDCERKKLYIVMEHCEGGDLDTLIQHYKSRGKFLSENFVLHILLQLCSALKHCHKRPDKSVVLHHDLKPANVFLDKNLNVKLGDFGVAYVLPSKDHVCSGQAGTLLYMSPEKVTKMLSDERSDIWALGCLIYELCAFVPPFTGGQGKKLEDCISSGAFRRIPVHYSDFLYSIIRDMLQVTVSRRPSAADIIKRLTDKCIEDSRSRHPDRHLPQPVSVKHISPKKKQAQAPQKKAGTAVNVSVTTNNQRVHVESEEDKEDDTSDLEVVSVEKELAYFPPERTSCIAHSLQLVLRPEDLLMKSAVIHHSGVNHDVMTHSMLWCLASTRTLTDVEDTPQAELVELLQGLQVAAVGSPGLRSLQQDWHDNSFTNEDFRLVSRVDPGQGLPCLACL